MDAWQKPTKVAGFPTPDLLTVSYALKAAKDIDQNRSELHDLANLRTRRGPKISLELDFAADAIEQLDPDEQNTCRAIPPLTVG